VYSASVIRDEYLAAVRAFDEGDDARLIDLHRRLLIVPSPWYVGVRVRGLRRP
jgi:hypothetical protein